MEVGKVLYPIKSLGINTRVGIWTVGCFRNCFNCSNPELQYSDKSKDASVETILESIKDFKFDGVTISGGEPFLQIKELAKLVRLINEQLHIDDILIFTGYTIKELESMNDIDVNYILSHISVLVDGPYIENLHTELPLQGSSNQVVHILNKKYEKEYKEYLSKEKTFDIFKDNKEVHFIGIPIKDYKEQYNTYLRGIRDE